MTAFLIGFAIVWAFAWTWMLGVDQWDREARRLHKEATDEDRR